MFSGFGQDEKRALRDPKTLNEKGSASNECHYCPLGGKLLETG